MGAPPFSPGRAARRQSPEKLPIRGAGAAVGEGAFLGEAEGAGAGRWLQPPRPGVPCGGKRMQEQGDPGHPRGWALLRLTG